MFSCHSWMFSDFADVAGESSPHTVHTRHSLNGGIGVKPNVPNLKPARAGRRHAPNCLAFDLRYTGRVLSGYSNRSPTKTRSSVRNWVKTPRTYLEQSATGKSRVIQMFTPPGALPRRGVLWTQASGRARMAFPGFGGKRIPET